MQTGVCRSCGAPIIWTVTAKSGKKMPVDEAASPQGTFVLEEKGRDVYAHYVHPDELKAGAERFTSHFSTCPDAKDWRKP